MIRQQVPDTMTTASLAVRQNGMYQVRWVDQRTGKQRRLSAKTRKLNEAKRFLTECQYKLDLDIDPAHVGTIGHSEMPWNDFFEEWMRLKLSTFTHRNQQTELSRIAIATSIIRPPTLVFMSKRKTLIQLADELAATRTPVTARSYMRSVVSMLNWGFHRSYLDAKVSAVPIKVPTPDKGRPLSEDEQELYIATAREVCSQDPAGWEHLIRGLLASGLRLGESMSLSYDRGADIRIDGDSIRFSGRVQKNKRLQIIPMLPAMIKLLNPEGKGFVFNPLNRRGHRCAPGTVQNWLARIGKESGIEVNDRGRFVSAHDLRRTYAQSLASAGVAVHDVQFVMRHASIKTTQEYYLRPDSEVVGSRIREQLGNTRS